jgi:hypothetical protein
MQDLTGLNNLYAEYRQGNLKKRDLEGMMFRIILKSIHGSPLFDGDEEAGIDYLCWLYPRLSRAIQNYQENGATFATYIGALIRYSLKEYRSRQYEHYLTEYAAWAAHTTDLEVRSPGLRYPEAEEDEPEDMFNPAPLAVLKSRQVLMLILKSYYFLSEDFIDRIAPLAGIKAENLRTMIENLRIRRSRREEERRLIQERITTQFYRCIVLERRLKTLLPGTARYGKIQTSLARTRKRLAGMRKRLARSKVNASHQQVAEILGISAGAVGSSLSMLKSHWGLDKEGRPVKKNRKAAAPRLPLPDLKEGDSGGDLPGASGDAGGDARGNAGGDNTANCGLSL